MINHRIVLLAAVVLSSTLHAQTFTVLLKDGDTPTGGPTVTSIDNLVVNSVGTWIVEATMTGNISVLVKNGAPFAVEGDPVPATPSATISSFDDLTLNNLGTSGRNLFLAGPPTNADSGIYVDSALVFQEGAISTAPQFSSNTPYIGFFGAKWNDSRQMLVMASVDDPSIASTVDRALVKLQLDASNALVSETVLMKEGDTLTGFGADVLTDFDTNPYSFAMNNQGSAMWIVDMNGVTTSDFAFVVDGVVIAREGSGSPLLGRNYEMLNGKPVDLSDGGHTAFRANLDGATTDDEVIVSDGAIVIQEGQTLPAISPFTFTAFGSIVRVDSAGHVFWFGDWNDPDTTRDTGLFVDHTLLVQEGVTIIGGQLVSNIASVQDTLTISPDGRYVIFKGQRPGTVDAAFMIDRGPNTTAFCFGDGTGTACPCTNSGATGHGCANSVFGNGALLTGYGYPGASAGSDTFVLTANEIPGPGLFFQGDGQWAGGLGIPLGDGLLCAGGAILRLGVVFPTGSSASFPGGTTPNPIHVGGATTSGDVRHYQCWYRDSATFCTSATNNLTQGLTATWGP